jgi:opacity protein-like surface antigen
VGTGHEGVRAATIASANVLYHFSGGRSQPYLTAGIGTLWSKGVSTMTFVRETQAVHTEQEWRDTELALNWSGGVRIFITRAMSLRSEVRFYDSTLRSRVNLSLIRASIGVGYYW